MRLLTYIDYVMKKTVAFFIFILLIFTSKSIFADVKLPSIISDNMLLQQNTKANIWGKADPNEQITITVSWNKQPYTTTADSSGKWLVKIATPKQTAKGQTLTIAGKNSITINNILIGEVWLCSGQSNMHFPIAKTTGWRTGVINEEETLKDANYPEIRLFQVNQKLSATQELDDCEGKWLICNAENIKDFSAVAFYFGRYLYNNLHVPIGLIHSSWGGTHAESWTKMSVIENDPIYADLLKQYYTDRDNYPADMAKYIKDSTKYEIEKAEAIAKGEKPGKKPKRPVGIEHNKALSTLWNAMIHPLVPYAIKGVIWYQGESNSVRYQDYTDVFTNMINSWRTEWKQGDFPFYFVQIAPHYKQPPQIREAQLNTWKTVKNTGMVVLTDVGDSTDIHPRNKQVPGERLAKWALAKDYGKKNAFSGPSYQSMQIAGNIAKLSFTYTNNGLDNKAGDLKGFYIAGDDKKFYPAIATIKGNTVEVSASEVKKPVAVRYGWDKFFRVNLYNGAGLPASPFRTDNWNE